MTAHAQMLQVSPHLFDWKAERQLPRIDCLGERFISEIVDVLRVGAQFVGSAAGLRIRIYPETRCPGVYKKHPTLINDLPGHSFHLLNQVGVGSDFVSLVLERLS